ncbi:hypothetical protein J6590_075173 [Homalodisca vitripennis]|nr:hypothetical protein J6590_075173 [Homalodisca vitripennis]
MAWCRYSDIIEEVKSPPTPEGPRPRHATSRPPEMSPPLSLLRGLAWDVSEPTQTYARHTDNSDLNSDTSPLSKTINWDGYMFLRFLIQDMKSLRLLPERYDAQDGVGSWAFAVEIPRGRIAACSIPNSCYLGKRIATALNTKETLPTPTVILCSRLDQLIRTFTVTSRQLRLVMWFSWTSMRSCGCRNCRSLIKQDQQQNNNPPADSFCSRPWEIAADTEVVASSYGGVTYSRRDLQGAITRYCSHGYNNFFTLSENTSFMIYRS